MKFTPAVLLLLASTTQARNPGFGGSITQEGINNAKNVATPFIFEKIKDLQIPEIDITGGKFTNLDIKVNQPALSDVNMLVADQTNSVELKAQNVSAVITSDFTYKYLFITVSGTANIKVNKMSVDAQMGLSTQPGVISGDVAPNLTSQKFDIGINPSDVDITLSGSAVAKIASVLIPLIKSSLIPSIVDTVQKTATDMITSTIDPDLAKYGTRVTIPYLAGTTFDFSQMKGGPTVTSNEVLEMVMDGTFYDANAPEVYSITPAAFEVRNPNGKTFQAYLTDYVLNTNMKACFDTKNTLDITYLLKQYLQVEITTDLIGQAIPELLTKYGSGKAVSIKGAFVKAPGVAKFTPTLDSITGLNLAVTLGVDSDVAIQAEFDSAAIAGLLNAKSGSLFGNVSQHTIGTVSNFQTTLGMDAAAFQKEFQTFVDTNIADLNTQLAAGIAVPTFMGISVSDFELNTSNGYAEIGLNATPATFKDLQDAWVSYKKEVDRIDAGEIKTQKWADISFEQDTGFFLQ